MANSNTDALEAQQLHHAASAEPMATHDLANGSGLEGTVSGTTAAGSPEHVAEQTALGFNTTGWVGIAALVVVALMLWRKVPAMIGRMLDARIADVRRQLDEAAALRADAEALKAEYEAKAKAAEADAATMRAHAHQEAAAIVTRAKRDAEDLMDRRARMAEDKIAAAERAAIAEVRAHAAEAATKAAGLLIAEQHNADADKAMIDRSIAGLGRLN